MKTALKCAQRHLAGISKSPGSIFSGAGRFGEGRKCFLGRRSNFSVKMSVSSGTSFVLSSILTVLIFSGMQMYRGWLGSSQLYTILGGYIGSMLFICVLTAIGNLETTVFGKSFQQKLFPEVVFALVLSLIASGLVHRVATTTCFLFSMVALYYMNRISQQTYVPVPTVQTYTKKRK